MIFRFAFKMRQKIFRQPYLSWEYFEKKTKIQKMLQPAYQSALKSMSGGTFGKDCYISPTSRVYTSTISVGDNSFISGGCIIRGDLVIGSGSGIGANCHIAGPVKIGNDTMIANNVNIFGFNHGTSPQQLMRHQPCIAHGVVIGDDCWVGANVSIVDGTTIGDHSIVATGAVVTKDVPDWTVVAGVPAKIIKYRKKENELAQLVQTRNLKASALEQSVS